MQLAKKKSRSAFEIGTTFVFLFDEHQAKYMRYLTKTSQTIDTVNVMHYQLEHARIRSMAALGLALTTSVIAMLSMLVSAL